MKVKIALISILVLGTLSISSCSKKKKCNTCPQWSQVENSNEVTA